MDIRKLQRAIVDGLEDVKGHDIVVLNTEHLSPLFERVIVVSGTSNRQTKALASSVRETVKSRGMAVLATEGADNGEWIIVDCGAAVAHIMQPEIRDYYRLEELWGGKPVHMKMGAAQVAPSARRQPGAPQSVAAPSATPAAPVTPAKAPRKRAAAPARAAATKTGPAVKKPGPAAKKPAPAAKRAPVRTPRPRTP